jgi:hypothetical protein
MERSKGRKGEDCRASWEEEVGELLLAVDGGGSLLLLFYGEEGRRGVGATWLLLLSMENKKDAGTAGEGRSSACTCARPGKQGGRREGRAHGGAGCHALAGERLLQGSSAIYSSGRGRPWWLAEQRCQPWELLAAMKQKGGAGR